MNLDSVIDLLLGFGLVGLFVLWGAARRSVEAAAVRGAEAAVDKKFREWEVRFSTLHLRRLDAMDGMFDRLVALKRQLDGLAGMQPLDDPHGERWLAKVTEAGNEADRFLATRRFYLPESSVERIAAFLKEAKSAWAEISTGIDGKARASSDRNAPIYSAHMSAGYRRVRNKLPELLEEVSEDFRSQVGGDE